MLFLVAEIVCRYSSRYAAHLLQLEACWSNRIDSFKFNSLSSWAHISSTNSRQVMCCLPFLKIRGPRSIHARANASSACRAA
jgi:hypothetical protein